MAHTLTFSHSKYHGNIVTIQERGVNVNYLVVHRDNLTVIADGLPSNSISNDEDRRVYKVREWIPSTLQLKCRATRME